MNVFENTIRRSQLPGAKILILLHMHEMDVVMVQ